MLYATVDCGRVDVKNVTPDVANAISYIIDFPPHIHQHVIVEEYKLTSELLTLLPS